MPARKQKSTLERVDALLREIDDARKAPDLSEAEKDDLRARELQALRTKSRIESDAANFKDVLIRNHPEWAALEQALVKALAECDRCSQAVDEVLSKSKL